MCVCVCVWWEEVGEKTKGGLFLALVRLIFNLGWTAEVGGLTLFDRAVINSDWRK